jgi:hypothetical protein
MSSVVVDTPPEAIDNFFGRLDAGLDDVADEVFAISQDLCPVDRGMLKKSGRKEYQFLDKVIIYDSPEATWNEFGTEPHMPPEEPIIGWVRRNASMFNISSRSKTAVKKVANSIRWKIYQHGTDPQPFLRPAFDDVQARAKEIILRHFR